MTSIRKAKKRIKRDMAENERNIAEFERMPVTLHTVFLLDALNAIRDIQIDLLNQLEKRNRCTN